MRQIARTDWSALRLVQVGKQFEGMSGNLHSAVNAIDLEIRRGDFYCLLGPSGCGKSTILNLIAGFEKATISDVKSSVRARPGARRLMAGYRPDDDFPGRISGLVPLVER